MAPIPYITAAEVEPHLDWAAVMEAIRAGHAAPVARLSDQFLTRGGDTLLSRAAWIDGLGIGVKSVTVIPENPARNLPSVHGAMVVFDDHTGQVRAVIDSALVTKWKTAGDSILGARLLARRDVRRLVIVGAGAVAASLIEAYRAVFPGIEVTLWARDLDKARALARAARDVAVSDDLEAAVRASDIISTATMARDPVVPGEWLQPGQHLDLIGAFKGDMRETDDEALRRSRIFVDSRETTLHHIGELKDPLARGVITESDVQGDLYDLVAGRAGRGSDEDITLFKNGGGAHLDLMTAGVILSRWQGA
jgi:ornithine cyclodeaminase/alanine dehydrogenase-like protein (mu-crystallin family)